MQAGTISLHSWGSVCSALAGVRMDDKGEAMQRPGSNAGTEASIDSGVLAEPGSQRLHSRGRSQKWKWWCAEISRVDTEHNTVGDHMGGLG